MPIVENGINYPTVLNRFNFPTELIRLSNRPTIGMAMARGETPVHLAQTFNGARVRQMVSVRQRQMPLLNKIRSRVKGLRGQASLIDGLGRNIPQPYVRSMWGPYANIGQVPSVIADTNAGTGPERTIHPQRRYLSVDMG